MTTRALIVRFRFGLLLAVALFATVGLTNRSAEADSTPDYRVIIHPDNASSDLGRDFVADVYLKRITRWPDGQTVFPVDQHPSSAVRQRFSESVLKRSVAAVKRYWQQRIFSGRELPPPELEGDQAVVGYVLKHRNAIGYVSGTAKLERAKPVSVH